MVPLVYIACAAATVLACSGPARSTTATPAPAAALVAPTGQLPDTITPLAYDLRLDIDPDSETVRGDVRIEVRIHAPTDHVWLHADQLTILTAKWHGGTLARADVQASELVAFRFGRTVAPGVVTLHLTFTASTNNEQQGLFRQRDGGAWYVFSQGQANLARRITPCFDEPRFKTPWRVTLVVPRRSVAVSNMPERSTTVRGMTKEVVFEESPPLPSYLVAVAVGPFEVVDAGTVGRNKVPLRVIVPAGKGGRVTVVVQRLPPIVETIETYLDDPLPLAKLDLVAVPDLFGAMENPGLVTFQASILVGDPKREGFASYFTAMAAHEMAHQWFGNLITPTSWDHLWLSEAFASWLGDKVVRALRAHDDAPLRQGLVRREAIEADHAPDALPLLRHVTSSSEAEEGLDSAAYAKGQLLLASVEAFVEGSAGTDAFRTLIRAHVARYRGRAITTSELLAVVGEKIDRGLATALEQSLAVAPTPVVELALHCDAGKPPRLVAKALGPAVPVCIAYGVGASATARRSCVVIGQTADVPVGTTCPAWVHANPDSAYFHTRWATHGPRGPSPKVTDLAPAARIVAGDDIAAAVKRGELAASDVLAELRALADAGDPYSQLGALAIAHAVDRLVEDAVRPAWTRWLAARFATRLVPEKRPPLAADTEVVESLIRLMPAESFHVTVTRRAFTLLDENLADMDEIAHGLVRLASVHGGDKLFDRLLVRARLIRAVDARPTWFDSLGELGIGQLPKAIAVTTNPDLDVGEAWRPISAYLARPDTRTAAWRAVMAGLPAILRRMSAAQAVEVIDAAVHLCDQQSRDQLVATLERTVHTMTDGRVHLDDALVAIDGCIARRAKLGDLVGALSASR